MLRRPLSELNISWNEFCYWQVFLNMEHAEDEEPEPMTAKEQLAFMRGIGNG